MNPLKEIFDAIASEGFSSRVLSLIDNYVNKILYGTESFPRFNIPEHAGLCTAGAPLIGASVVACYARASLEASSDAGTGQTGRPSNWEIDDLQERLIEQWARAANLWEDDSEKILIETFGPKIAEGASIYSTTQKALEAIALHNYLFPETTMRVIGFTRDSDHLFRIVLTQPYVSCKRLATKEEIDELAFSKGFRDN